jgi:Carbon monoxide dehydrogenase subunit G (CoxG)
MKINNEFTVSVPLDEAWEVLTDLAGIAPCLPGAQLTGSEGEVYSGKIKNKVGPLSEPSTRTRSGAPGKSAALRKAPDVTQPAHEAAAPDLMQLAGETVAKRVVPVAIGVAVVVALVTYRIVR